MALPFPFGLQPRTSPYRDPQEGQRAGNHLWHLQQPSFMQQMSRPFGLATMQGDLSAADAYGAQRDLAANNLQRGPYKRPPGGEQFVPAIQRGRRTSLPGATVDPATGAYTWHGTPSQATEDRFQQLYNEGYASVAGRPPQPQLGSGDARLPPIATAQPYPMGVVANAYSSAPPAMIRQGADGTMSTEDFVYVNRGGRRTPVLRSEVRPWEQEAGTTMNTGKYMPPNQLAQIYNNRISAGGAGSAVAVDANGMPVGPGGQPLEAKEMFNALQSQIYRDNMNSKNAAWDRVRQNRWARQAGLPNAWVVDQANAMQQNQNQPELLLALANVAATNPEAAANIAPVFGAALGAGRTGNFSQMQSALQGAASDARKRKQVEGIVKSQPTRPGQIKALMEAGMGAELPRLGYTPLEIEEARAMMRPGVTDPNNPVASGFFGGLVGPNVYSGVQSFLDWLDPTRKPKRDITAGARGALPPPPTFTP